MGKQGKDSDHYGVEVLPRTNLAPKAGALREKIKVQRFPESKIVDFGFHLVDESWSNLKENMSTTDLVDIFVRTNSNLVDKVFPSKEVLVGPKDLPYFTEELRLLKRQRLRAYTTHGGKSVQYLNLKARFEDKLKSEAMKYVSKIETEVSEGKRGSSYKAIRKTGRKLGPTRTDPAGLY